MKLVSHAKSTDFLRPELAPQSGADAVLVNVKGVFSEPLVNLANPYIAVTSLRNFKSAEKDYNYRLVYISRDSLKYKLQDSLRRSYTLLSSLDPVSNSELAKEILWIGKNAHLVHIPAEQATKLHDLYLKGAYGELASLIGVTISGIDWNVSWGGLE